MKLTTIDLNQNYRGSGESICEIFHYHYDALVLYGYGRLHILIEPAKRN